ncbi:Transcription factor lepE [Lachnellula suecica]|uniref:Transcription factor lepE n=1 Tax=Lachnellula suecica TaxID=602035 RepID=A0A8T9C0Q2_9HELO|nr:Transcription factor lepE [Lachnellula suecica]
MQLEEQLSRSAPGSTPSTALSQPLTPHSAMEESTSSIGGHFALQPGGGVFGSKCQVSSRSVMHKERLYGRSHWSNGIALFRDVLEIIEPLIREDASKAFSGIRKCKNLAKTIKNRRAPPWPSPTRADLPSKDFADELVACYLRTSETLYRVLHVPTFTRDYEAFWNSNTPPDQAFLVQLKLVLAIGATTYDEKFSLRASAVKWVYEAQSWVSEPEFKTRLNMQSLQTTTLLLLARETACLGQSLIWISAGSLLRAAVYKGLHRDPFYLPKKCLLLTEMRRRLWNTILEINLQSAIDSGGSPMISYEDFDTEPPGNFDDDQLMVEDTAAKPDAHFTQASIAIALRKTFPLRLAIAKFLNGFGSRGTYEEALRHDADFRVQYKTLCQTLQAFSSSPESKPSRFGLCTVDFIMSRYLSSIHVPFFGQAQQEAAHAFSRKVVIETSLKMWYAAYPSSSMAGQSGNDTVSSDRDDFARLVCCGSGFFRTSVFQASFLLTVELRTQLQEHESLGPMPLRPDLLCVIDDAKIWSLKVIEAGETNVKGYLLLCLIGAQIEGLRHGLGKDETAKLLVKAAEEAEDKCLPILEAKVAEGQMEGNVDDLNRMPLGVAPVPEDWDFIMSSAQFNFGDEDPMGWVFNDGTTQEPSFW